MVLAGSQSTTIHVSIPQATDGIAAINISCRAATASAGPAGGHVDRQFRRNSVGARRRPDTAADRPRHDRRSGEAHGRRVLAHRKRRGLEHEPLRCGPDARRADLREPDRRSRPGSRRVQPQDLPAAVGSMVRLDALGRSAPRREVHREQDRRRPLRPAAEVEASHAVHGQGTPNVAATFEARIRAGSDQPRRARRRKKTRNWLSGVASGSLPVGG